MADVVQYRLERMTNELEDLERRGIFTHRAIKEIVKKRKEFENKINRHSPLKQDFLAYIEYEKKVDLLRLYRKKQMKDKCNKKMKKSVSDFAGVSRILDLYRLASNRFKGDIELWFQYLEFCRQRKNGRMKKVLAQVLRFHPKVPGLWTYAAAWEFDHNLNVAAARSLMQRGLRACPTSEDLYVEYLRMELTHLNKLKARKVALGEDEGTLSRVPGDVNDKHWREENKDLFMSLDEEGQNDDILSVQNEESKRVPGMFQEQGMSVLQAVYSEALEKVPSSLNLRQRFFEILEATNLAQSEEMRKRLLGDMKRDFSTKPEYWDWLARLEISDPRSTQEMNREINAIQVYEEALEIVPSATMFKLYRMYLMEVIARTSKKNKISDLASDPVSHIFKVYEKAETMGCITEDLACQHVSFYLQLGNLDEARKLAEKLCCGKLSNSMQMWLLRVSIEMRCITRKSPSLSKADFLSVFELLSKVLTRVSVSEAESLWLMALQFFANEKRYFDKLVELSLISLTRHGGSENRFSLSSAIVNFVLLKDGIQHAREMYKRYLGLPHPGLAFYRSCIELEMNLALVGDKVGLENARKLYEAALASYEQDVSLWKDYHSMEIKMGTSETSNAVSWRARKTLKNSAAFIASTDL